MAPEDERPAAWGDPAPVFGDVDQGTRQGADESAPNGDEEGKRASVDQSTYRRADERPDDSTEQSTHLGARDPVAGADDEDPGTSPQGWETAAPVLVSENGSPPVERGHVSAPGWPIGAGHARVTRRREHRVLRGIRSGVALTIIALALGVAVAAGLGVIVWLIATAIHHAAAN